MKEFEVLESEQNFIPDVVDLYLDSVIPFYSDLRVCKTSFTKYCMKGLPKNIKEDLLKIRYVFIPLQDNCALNWSLVVAKISKPQVI